MYVKLGGSKNPIAYCNLHKATLDFSQMQAKDCLNKKCFHLKKFDVPFWDKRDTRKKQAKGKRQYARAERDEMIAVSNVEIGKGKAYYDEKAVETRSENMLKPITLTGWGKKSDEEKKQWLRKMHEKFPNISPRLYERALGLAPQMLTRQWKNAGLSQGKNHRYYPSPEEVKEWNLFWGITQKPKEETTVKVEEKTVNVPAGGILEVPAGTKVVVEEEPKVGKVVYMGTLRGKAEDVLAVMRKLGIADREISVNISD